MKAMKIIFAMRHKKQFVHHELTRLTIYCTRFNPRFAKSKEVSLWRSPWHECLLLVDFGSGVDFKYSWKHANLYSHLLMASYWMVNDESCMINSECWIIKDGCWMMNSEKWMMHTEYWMWSMNDEGWKTKAEHGEWMLNDQYRIMNNEQWIMYDEWWLTNIE